MKVSGYQCECGVRKGEGNRWILGVLGSYYLSEEKYNVPIVSLRPWHDDMAEDEDVVHFCSDSCALKWQSKELERMGR